MKNTPFVIERVFDARAKKLWNAITDNKEMKKWYFDVPEFKPQAGCKFQFSAGKDDKQYVHLCEVTEVVSGKKITYSWRYEDYKGISFVTFELFPEENRTRLKLTHAGLETFPKSNPDLAPENFAEGWASILDQSLKSYIKKKEENNDF